MVLSIPRYIWRHILLSIPPSPLFPFPQECTLLFGPPARFFVAHNGGGEPWPTNTCGSNHRPKSVRPNRILAFDSKPLLTFSLPSLERAVGSALKNYFTPLRPTSDARVDFYNKFKREAEDYDKEFLDKYDGDLDTTLIFVGLPLIINFGCDIN